MNLKSKQAVNAWRRVRGTWAALLLCIGVLAASSLQAQEATTLTLQEALKYALQANQSARKALLDVENSQYRIDEVRSQALPQVNGTAALTYNPLLQLSAIPNLFGANPNPNETILIAFGQKWNANAGLSFQQTLFDKSVFTGLKAAKTTKEFYQLNSQLTDEQIIEQVATNYYQVLVQRQKIGVIDSTIRNTMRVQEVIRGQYASGLARKIDVDRIAVNISNLNSQRQQLLNGVTQLENALKFYMGMPIQTPIVLPPVEFDRIHPHEVPQDDTLDIGRRTEYQVLQKQGELLRYQKEASKAAYYPTLSFSGNYNYQGISNNFPVFKGRKEGVNWFDYSTLSVGLRVPLFNGFATRARVRQADISIRRLNEDIANTKLSLNLSFENAKSQINNSLITLNSQRENVRLAQEVFSNTQNNYNNGLATLTDLLDAENSLTEAQNNLSAALLDYRVAEIQLIKAQGELKTLLK